MAASRFVRWSGLAAVVSGALWMIVFAIHAAVGGEGPMSWTNGRL
jgi:hypothetical protein